MRIGRCRSCIFIAWTLYEFILRCLLLVQQKLWHVCNYWLRHESLPMNSENINLFLLTTTKRPVHTRCTANWFCFRAVRCALTISCCARLAHKRTVSHSLGNIHSARSFRTTTTFVCTHSFNFRSQHASSALKPCFIQL